MFEVGKFYTQGYKDDVDVFEVVNRKGKKITTRFFSKGGTFDGLEITSIIKVDSHGNEYIHKKQQKVFWEPVELYSYNQINKNILK